MDFTVLLTTTFSADLLLPDFQPGATIMALHITMWLPQVCSSLWVSLKGEPGPARVVGRPWALLFFAYTGP